MSYKLALTQNNDLRSTDGATLDDESSNVASFDEETESTIDSNENIENRIAFIRDLTNKNENIIVNLQATLVLLKNQELDIMTQINVLTQNNECLKDAIAFNENKINFIAFLGYDMLVEVGKILDIITLFSLLTTCKGVYESLKPLFLSMAKGKLNHYSRYVETYACDTDRIGISDGRNFISLKPSMFKESKAVNPSIPTLTEVQAPLDGNVVKMEQIPRKVRIAKCGGKKTKMVRLNDDSKVKCFRCNNFGHISAQCTEACRICKKPGHKESLCYFRKQNGNK